MPLSVRLLPYRSIAQEVATRLSASRRGIDPLEPFAEEVIVASGGVGSAVAAALIRQMPRGAAGLRMQTVDALAQRVVNASGSFPHVASDAERRLAMRTATRTIPEPLFESRGIASMLERSYRDVRDSGLTLDEFSRRADRASLRNGARTRLIVRAWRAYEDLVARLGAIDPADLLLDAAKRVRSGATLRPQILAGFYDMTGVQAALVDALAARALVVEAFVPVRSTEGDYAFAAPFVAARGTAVPELQLAASAEPEVVICPTLGSEIDTVAASVGRLLADGAPASSIAITARRFEPLDLAMLERAARRAGFAISTRREVPLVAQRIGRGAVTLLRLKERGFPRRDVFELLGDGLRLTIGDADRADSETRRHGVSGGTSSELAHLRGKSSGLKEYLDVVAQLEEITASIDDAFLSSLATRFTIASETDARAAEALDSVAALFRRASVWNQPLDVASVVDAISHTTIAPFALEQERVLPVVWAGDAMKLRGRTFDHVFSLRSEDDLLPQRRTEDPLLPDSDRAALGIRRIGDGEEEERLLFRLVRDSAVKSLTFSFAASDGFGKSLRMSRFVRDFPSRKAAPAATAPAGRPRPRALQLYAQAGTGSVFDGAINDREVLQVIRRKAASLSPTQLEDFGECPQKFFLKHILDVKDIDDPDRDLQIAVREKGILDHGILEEFYKALTREELAEASMTLPALPVNLRERLDRIIDREFDLFDREHPAHNTTIRVIEREATRRILRDFVAADLDDLAKSGLFPKHFEYRFGTRHRDANTIDHPEPFFVRVGDVDVPIEGTIDRIDRGGAQLRVVDYKSGKAIRYEDLEKKILRGIRLQLPLYAMAAASFFAAQADQVTGTIKPLVPNRSGKHAFKLAETQGQVLATLELFIKSILDGRFPTFPEDTKAIGSCKYCPVNSSCRTKHDAEESRNVQRWGDARSLLLGEAAEVNE